MPNSDGIWIMNELSTIQGSWKLDKCISFLGYDRYLGTQSPVIRGVRYLVAPVNWYAVYWFNPPLWQWAANQQKRKQLVWAAGFQLWKSPSSKDKSDNTFKSKVLAQKVKCVWKNGWTRANYHMK